MTRQLTPAALAELDQWEAAGRASITSMVQHTIARLDAGTSPALVAHTIAHGAEESDPERVASGFGWAVVALAEHARQVRS